MYLNLVFRKRLAIASPLFDAMVASILEIASISGNANLSVLF
jgi:hypothetical protein